MKEFQKKYRKKSVKESWKEFPKEFKKKNSSAINYIVLELPEKIPGEISAENPRRIDKINPKGNLRDTAWKSLKKF